MTGLKISLYDTGAPPACPAPFNMVRHTLFHDGAKDAKVALEVLATPGEVAESWTYGELRTAVLSTASGLSDMGIGRGDRVVIRIGHRIEFPILFFALQAVGAVPVPISPMLTPHELAAIVADVEPACLCVDETTGDAGAGREKELTLADLAAMRGLPPAVIAETDPNDTALVVYTSGTGGRPKGVEHAHRAAWARRMMWANWYGLTPGDRVLHAGAFNWTFTLGAGLSDPWAAGATALIYTGSPDPGVWAMLAMQHGATIFAAVPGVYRQLLNSDTDCRAGFSGLRHGITAGEALPAGLLARWTEATGKPLFEAYGMSEISTFVSSGPDTPVRPGSAGRPQHGRRVAILPEDGGEAPVPAGTPGLIAIWRRDPGLMKGYWRQPEATSAACRGEWFVSSDRAVMDADGYIFHLGRADEVMNAQGYRVSPQEVEQIIRKFDGIEDCAVAEVAVRRDVNVVGAFFVGDPGVDEDALTKHCQTFLAAYKCPRIVRRVDALPRNANGKLMRRELTKSFSVKA
ncbi:MAG: class I adenylate-forming enzyme family protein [Paracoccaceae bacterium]